MKRIMCGAAALLLALLLCGQALAAGSAEPVRTFVYEDTLYTYVRLEGIDSPITQVEAKIGAQSFPASSRLETVRQAGFPITYLLLVDNSNSMPPFRAQLEEFCKELAADSGENTRFILATLGDQFQVVNENVPADSIGEQLAAVPLDETVTRLHTCMNSALDYFETLPRQGTELRAMVVITDGVQYDPLGGVPHEELLERLTHSDVMLHSMGMGSDSEALDSLGKLTESSGGIHQVLTGSLTAGTAAKTLTDAAGELMVTGFDLGGQAAAGENQEVSFTFASSGTLLCRGEAAVDIPGEEDGQTAAAGDESESAAEGETAAGTSAGADESAAETSAGADEETAETSAGADEETAETSVGADEETAGTSAGESGESPEETSSAPAAVSSQSQIGGGGPEDSGSQTQSGEKTAGGSGILPAAGIAAAVIALAAILLIVRGRRAKGAGTKTAKDSAARAENRGAERRDASAPPAQAAQAQDTAAFEDTAFAETADAGIYMRIEAGEGVAIPGGNTLTLSGELLIGGDASCGILLTGAAAPRRAARLFLEDGFVCIEALDAQVQVLVNGEPLTGSRRLRSGSCVSIGGREIRPMF